MGSRRVVKVLELPEDMAHFKFRHGYHRPVVQFIMDWNDQPERRVEMLCGGKEPVGKVPSDLVLIAAVVHGLCDRDGIAVPEWVASHRLRPPITMSRQPADSEWGRWVVSQAPPVCFEHGVFFEAEMLSAT